MSGVCPQDAHARMPLVVDSEAWTGRPPLEEARALASLAGNGVLPIPRHVVPDLYAVSDHLARSAGIAVPLLLYSPKFGGFSAAAYPRFNWIVLTGRGLSLPPVHLKALLAHEIGHIAARHRMSLGRRCLLSLQRPLSFLALGLSLALDDAFLALATAASFAISETVVRRSYEREEAEADAWAAQLMGSVVPLLDVHPKVQLWWQRLWRACLHYPARRPWIDRMAAAELVNLHNYIAAQGREMMRPS